MGAGQKAPQLRFRAPAASALLAAQFIGGTGDYAYIVAISVWIFERSDSVGWVTASILARMVPRVVLGRAGGRLADTTDRRRLLIRLDLARGTLVLSIAAAISFETHPALVVALVSGVSIIGVPASTASMKYLSHLVNDVDRARLNASYELAAQATLFTGPAVAAILFSVGTATWVVAANAASFFVTAAINGQLPSTKPDEMCDEGHQPLQKKRQTLLGGSSGCLAVATAVLIQTVQFGFEQSAFPIFAAEVQQSGDTGAAQLFASFGIGGLTVGLFGLRHLGRCSRANAMYAAFAVEGICVGTLALGIGQAPALAALFVAGAASFVFELILLARLQLAIPLDQLGTFYGTLTAISAAGTVLGALLLPMLIGPFGLSRVTFGVTALSIIAAAALSLSRDTFAQPQVTELGEEVSK